MSPINAQAKELNNLIQKTNPAIYNLLSEKGRGFFFPKLGIVKQAGDAKGKKINATIGIALEDDGGPLCLKSIASQINLDPKDVFPYAPSYGKPDLRKTWQGLIRKKNPSLKADISMPVVTNALTHGLSIAGLMFLDPGDKLIVPDKFWGNYRLIFGNAHGAELVTFNTFTETGFDIQSLKDCLAANPGKQVLVLNFPNNPTGYTPTVEEAEAITQVILDNAEKGNEIAVLMDDAYFGLVYEDGIFMESLFTKLADLHDNILAVKIDGATKEDYVWGLRVGFMTFANKKMTPEVSKALEDKAGGIVRGTISNDSHLSQSLILHAIASPTYEAEKKEKYNTLKKRFETVKSVLDSNKEKYSEYFEPLPFNSGYFMCVALKKGLEGEAIRQILLNEFSTGVIAIGNLIRIAFSATPTQLIAETFENLYQACKKADQ